MNNFGEKVSFIWSVADLLRNSYRPNRYKDLMVPMTMLRRLEAYFRRPQTGRYRSTWILPTPLSREMKKEAKTFRATASQPRGRASTDNVACAFLELKAALRNAFLVAAPKEVA